MEAATQGSGANIMMIGIALLFIFMMVFSGKSEKKRAQAAKQMQDALQKDDKVVIFGNIVGTIVGFKDDIVEVKISENNKVSVLKSGILRVISK